MDVEQKKVKEYMEGGSAMGRRGSRLELAGDLVQRGMQALGGKALRSYRMHMAFHRLPELIGAPFARQIEIQGIRHRRLYLHVANPVWRNEAWMYRERILQQLNEAAGETLAEEIVFTRRWQEPDLPGGEKKLPAPSPPPGQVPLHRLRRVDLGDEALAAIEESCARVENEELRKRLLRLAIRREQLERLREEGGWQPCKGCGALCPPGEGICAACRIRERREAREAIRRMLVDAPWMRYPEIRKSVPCTPQMVSSVRDSMVQQLAARVRLEDMDSLDAKTLAMLYRCVPPDELTEDTVRRALYRLRRDLARGKDDRPVRRYDIIQLGAKAKGGKPRVRASRERRVSPGKGDRRDL